MGGQSHGHPQQCAGSSTLHDLSLDTALFTQFICEISEGEAREVIWSSVNDLFISASLI